MRRVSGVIAFLVAFVVIAVAAPPSADALYRGKLLGGDADFAGRIRSVNIFRNRDVDQFALIMQRNELKLRFEWKWLMRGKAFGKYKVPWLNRSDIFMLYRGIYDGVYDIQPGGIHGGLDFQGDPLTNQERSLSSIDKGTRDNLKFNNRLREAYIDLYFKHLPLTMRMGKQQIVWGETDGFRMLDRANTLDLSWHFFQELPPPGFGFDEIRQPFWMIKGLWDFRQLGPLSQPFLEFYWNPGDWHPGKIAFQPRPWGVNLTNPLENPFGTGVLQNKSFCGVEDPSDSSRAKCSLFRNTELFERGDWKRNPIENSQFGVRFHFITQGGYEWTINYLYQRFSPDGSPVALVRGKDIDGQTLSADGTMMNNVDFCRKLSSDPNSIFADANARGQLCLEYFAPYVHTLGASLNFFESNWTQTVWRLETIIDFDLPFYDGNKRTTFSGSPGSPALLAGISKRNMWKGMLAFDRPTWIRALNKKTTFFVTGQFFWHYLINMEHRRCIDQAGKIVDAGEMTVSRKVNCGGIDPDTGELVHLLPGENWGLLGPLDSLKLARPTDANGDPRTRDTIHQWELLATLAVIGFYRGGSVVPAFIYLLDPVNSYSQEVAMGVDWFVTPDIAVNVSTRLIWAGAPWDAYKGHRNKSDVDTGQIFDPWFLAGGSRGRSETSFMLTWQF